MPEPEALPAGDGRQWEGTPRTERLEAVVTGRVQGVGFRRYVRGWARRLELGGWVRNEPNGTVHLVAEGGPEALDRLSRLLWGGPPGARVDDVTFDRTDLGPPAHTDRPARTDRQSGAEFEIRH